MATALLQLILFDPARATDGKPDECGLASVYSTLSEETASGQDASINDRTGAHRSLPFGTLVRVDMIVATEAPFARLRDLSLIHI